MNLPKGPYERITSVSARLSEIRDEIREMMLGTNADVELNQRQEALNRNHFSSIKCSIKCR